MKRKSIPERLLELTGFACVSELRIRLSSRELGRLLSQMPRNEYTLQDWLKAQEYLRFGR